MRSAIALAALVALASARAGAVETAEIPAIPAAGAVEGAKAEVVPASASGATDAKEEGESRAADEGEKPGASAVEPGPALVAPEVAPQSTPESAPAPEAAPEPIPEPDPAPPANRLEVQVNGYLDTRTTVQALNTGGILPFSTLPRLANISEGNVQLKLRWGDAGLVYADASLFWQAGGKYLTRDATGAVVDRDSFDNPALKPLAVASELYGTWNLHPSANLTLGKKRIVWGPGLAQNPTDLINPPKDPTDPTFQRAGSWLGRLEFPFESFTVSLVAAAKVLRQSAGLPTALVYYPDYDTRRKADGTFTAADADLYPHFATAARLYALFLDTDFNLFYFFTNQFNDAFRHKHRAGFSVSRTFDVVETHVEVLLQQGSSRQYVSEACVESAAALGACVLSDLRKDPSIQEAPGDVRGSPAKRTLLDDPWVRAKALVGANWFFADNASVSLEYFFNMEGYTREEFDRYARALHYVLTSSFAAQAGGVMGGGTSDPGTPQKFSFDPLRQHYAFLTYNQRQIFDDWSVLGVLVLGLEDLSGQFVPQVTWSAQEWLNVTAGVFVPLAGLPALATKVEDREYTEYGLLPVGLRGFLSLRAFY